MPASSAEEGELTFIGGIWLSFSKYLRSFDANMKEILNLMYGTPYG